MWNIRCHILNFVYSYSSNPIISFYCLVGDQVCDQVYDSFWAEKEFEICRQLIS